MLISSYITRALRIFLFFNSSVAISFTNCLKISLYHNFLNNLLPMRAGEISYPLLLNKYLGINFKPATASLIWFRFLDLIVLLSLATYALNSQITKTNSFYIISIFLFFTPLFLYLSSKFYSTDVPKIKNKRNIFSKIISFLISSIPSTKKVLFVSWLLTLINWSLKLSAFSWFISFTLQIDIYNSLLASITSELTSILPIHSLAGFGTYEAGIVSVLVPQNIVELKSIIATATSLHLIILATTLASVVVFHFIPYKNLCLKNGASDKNK